MNIDLDERWPTEIEALQIVVQTMGENAESEDEMAVAYVLAGLLMRLQRAQRRMN